MTLDAIAELPALAALKVSCAANDETPPARARSARSRAAFPDAGASGASGGPSREDTAFDFAGTSPTPATFGVSPLSASPVPGDARWGLGVEGAVKGRKISPVSVLTVPALDLSVSFEDEDAADATDAFDDKRLVDASSGPSFGASASFKLDRVSAATPSASPEISALTSAGFGSPAAGPRGFGFGFGSFDAVPPTPARPRRLDAFGDDPGDRAARGRPPRGARREEDDDAFGDDEDAWYALSDDSANDAATDPMETDETDDFPPPFSLAALDGDRGRIVETAGAARAAERAAERGGRAAASGAHQTNSTRRAFPPRRTKKSREEAPFRAPRLERADSLSQTKLLAQSGLHRSVSLRADDGRETGGTPDAKKADAESRKNVNADASATAPAAPAKSAASAFTFHDHFEFKSLLGKTSTSEAWAVRSKVSGARYCVKRVTEAFRSGAARARCLHEVQAVTNLPAHENVVKYHRAWQEDRHFFAQMELCERGSFGGFLDRLKRLQEEASSVTTTARLLAERDVWRFARDVALGLAHCHAHGVLHLDVKPENVFVSRDGACKIGDFGVAWVVDSGWEVQDGDGGYVAPEMLNLNRSSTTTSGAKAEKTEKTRETRTAKKNSVQTAPTDRADVFSFGASVFEAACGARLPAEWRAGVPTWSDDAASSVPSSVQGAPGSGNPKRRYWDGLRFPPGRSDELRAYVTVCLRRDPSHRPSAADLAKHASMIENTFDFERCDAKR